MAKYKYYDYSQTKLIPISLEEQLMPGTLEFAIHTLVETRIERSVFDNRYGNDEAGRLAYDPKILLKVVLFSYSRGLLSSRQIERACRENVTFMALSWKVKVNIQWLLYCIVHNIGKLLTRGPKYAFT